MTKEEAIKIINCYDIGFYDLSGEKIPADKLAEAFDMAIEALKEKKTKVICDYDDCKWIESGVCQKDSIDLGKPVYVTIGCPNGEEDDDE